MNRPPLVPHFSLHISLSYALLLLTPRCSFLSLVRTSAPSWLKLLSSSAEQPVLTICRFEYPTRSGNFTTIPRDFTANIPMDLTPSRPIPANPTYSEGPRGRPGFRAEDTRQAHDVERTGFSR